MQNTGKKIQKRIAVLYHADCTDGFGAAWAAWKKLGNEAMYIAVPPSNRVVPEAARGKDVYTLDYAFPQDVIPHIRKEIASLTVIDHHITNKNSAENADEQLFDIGHSGAVLSWKFFHPRLPVPKLLKYIEDYDLWKFRFKNTRAVGEALSLYAMNFKIWDAIIEDFDNGKEKKYGEEGNVLIRSMERRIGRLIGFGEKYVFEGYPALMVNSSFYVSEIGHSIVKHGTPLAIIWSRREGKVVVSLRSDGRTVNVAELAERYGGGGHPAAAGFSFEVKDFLKLVPLKTKTELFGKHSSFKKH